MIDDETPLKDRLERAIADMFASIPSPALIKSRWMQSSGLAAQVTQNDAEGRNAILAHEGITKYTANILDNYREEQFQQILDGFTGCVRIGQPTVTAQLQTAAYAAAVNYLRTEEPGIWEQLDMASLTAVLGYRPPDQETARERLEKTGHAEIQEALNSIAQPAVTMATSTLSSGASKPERRGAGAWLRRDKRTPNPEIEL